MNLILHYVDPFNKVDGNTITLLDLYYYMKDKCDIEIIFFTCYEQELSFLKPVINGRYIYQLDIPLFNTKSSNIQLQRACLKQYKNIVLTDATFNRLNIQLNCKRFLVINSWYSFYYSNSYPDNVITFNENYLCGKVNYTKKINLEVIKDVRNTSNSFILANGERRLVQYELDELSSMFDDIILCQDDISNLDTSRVKLFDINTDLFDYNSYVYVPTKTYEFAPRMLLESCLLNKYIYYYKYPDNKNVRFDDVISGNLNKYLLTDTDEIVQILGE